MARFKKRDTTQISGLRNKKCYQVIGTLTLADVSKLNSLNDNIVLIFENTRGQNSDVIGGLDQSKIELSVMGGINYLEKEKYRDIDYIDRTFYTPKNLCNIIKAFEKIERQINYSWTEAQKCMFVYKTLVESMHYVSKNEPKYQNGKDIVRTLNGILSNTAVCSGFALILKEAMDRIGIECLYQNLSHQHSWNAVKLDGKYYLLDLTWDVTSKKDNKCNFYYFCRQNGEQFYKDEYHDISKSYEEIRLYAESMDYDELSRNYTKIVHSKKKYSGPMIEYKNSKNETYYYKCIGEKNGMSVYVVMYKGMIDYYYIDKQADIRKTLESDNLDIVNSRYGHNISRGYIPPKLKIFQTYHRNDGSSFVICKTNSELENGLNEYYYIEPCIRDGKNVLKRDVIITENNLLNDDPNFKYYVSNYLISEARLNRKIDYFNGYIGYLGSDSQVYYNQQFEVEQLGIQKRM